MKFFAADRKAYPKLYNYIRYSLPKVATVGVIVNNLQRYGSLSPTQSRHALRWDSDPLIVITPLFGGQCGVSAANGCFKPSSPGQIEISRERALDFETGKSSAFDTTSSGKKVYIVGITILHELCHWGRNMNKVPYLKGEEGVDFEVKTYGRNTG